MPLRIRLLLVLVLLVALALAAIEAITYNTIQTSLISTVDSQMKSSVGPWEGYFQSCNVGFCSPSAPEGVQPDTFAAAYRLSGKVEASAEVCIGPCPNPTPSQFPRPVLSRPYITSAASSNVTYQWATTAGTLGVHSFRVLTTLVQEPPGFHSPTGITYVLVVAFPLTATSSTLRHILTLEIIIGACILVAVAGASWFFVRLGLRPLENMANTASEIAAGDLSRRIEDTNERTEVERSGSGLPQRNGCGASSGMPPTSCGRHLRRSGATRSCSRRAWRSGLRICPPLSFASRASRLAWADWWMTCCSWNGSTRAGPFPRTQLTSRNWQRTPFRMPASSTRRGPSA